MKKIIKKLVLNKETVSNLNNEEMNDLKGGDCTIYTDCRIGTCISVCDLQCNTDKEPGYCFPDDASQGCPWEPTRTVPCPE